MKDTKELVRKIIGTYVGTEREAEIPFLFEKLPEPPLKILDVGCSESSVIYELTNLGYDIHGIDMVKYELPIAKFHKGDARNMPYQDNEFDYVICISALEHFGKVNTPYKTDKVEDTQADIVAMEEMYRVLKPNGRLILTLPTGYGEPHWLEWVKFYNQAELDAILTRFKIVEKRYSKIMDTKWQITNQEDAEHTYSRKLITANICLELEK